MREATVASGPDALIASLSDLDLGLSGIGLQADPLSPWLSAGLAKAGFAVELLETCHVHDAFKTMPIKTDKKDGRSIVQLMADEVAGPLTGWVPLVPPVFFG